MSRTMCALSTLLALFSAECGDGGPEATDAEGSSSGGGETGDPTGGEGLMDVELRFRGAVGDEELSCAGAYSGVGASGSMIEVMDFRFYVHAVELLRKDGTAVPLELTQDGAWQYEDVALIDLEDGTGSCTNGSTDVNARIVGKAPAGSYAGVRFVLGLPMALNHGDAAVAPSPLNITSLFWSWQDGYKFARIDLKTTGADLWAIHLGSTGCMMDGNNQVTGCAAENRATVEITDVDPTQATITADLLALIQAADVDVNQMGTAPGCMSEPADADCDPVFAGLGLPHGAQPAGAQTFFSVR